MADHHEMEFAQMTKLSPHGAPSGVKVYCADGRVVLAEPSLKGYEEETQTWVWEVIMSYEDQPERVHVEVLPPHSTLRMRVRKS
jgi:hypothetical protein